MLAESRVTYHFQPIFDRNGEAAAYEALMRPEMPNPPLARHGHEARAGDRTAV